MRAIFYIKKRDKHNAEQTTKSEYGQERSSQVKTE